MQGVLSVHVTKQGISFVSPAPSLAEEGSGALPVHELFFSPGFLGNINIHEVQQGRSLVVSWLPGNPPCTYLHPLYTA